MVNSRSLTISDNGTDGKVVGADDSGVGVIGGGSFTLESGTVSGDTDGIWVNNGAVEIKGGTVSGGIDGVQVYTANASLKLSGAPSITGGEYGGIYLSYTNPMTIAGKLTYTTPISVLWEPSEGVYTGVFTSGYSAYCGDVDPGTYFTAAKSGYKVVWDDSHTEAAIVKAYTVEFKNADEAGTVLQSSQLVYGETPVYTGETPVVEPTERYDFKFAGWTDGEDYYDSDEALPAVEGDVTYTAIYELTPRHYEVVFVDEDGKTKLKSGAYEYGTPAADIAKPADPSKQADDQYTYKFAGWTPEIADVTGEATYTAVYTKQGTITFDLGEGMLDGKTGTITIVADVGEKASAPGAPTLEGYTFKHWEGSQLAAGEEFTVEGNHSYTAVYEKNAPAGPNDSTTPSEPTIVNTGDSSSSALGGLALAAVASVAVLAGCAMRRREG